MQITGGSWGYATPGRTGDESLPLKTVPAGGGAGHNRPLARGAAAVLLASKLTTSIAAGALVVQGGEWIGPAQGFFR